MLLYRTQFDDGGEELWSIRRQWPLPARLVVVVPPNERWWPAPGEVPSRHASNRLFSLDPGSGAAPLPGSTEFGPFEACLDAFAKCHQRWVVPPPPAWLVTAVGDEWTIAPRHHHRIEFCKAAHIVG